MNTTDQASFPSFNPPPHEPRTVLVVDDECSLRELFVMILRHLGYEVLSAGSALEALTLAKAWRGEPIDLLITDLAMPGMDGGALADRMRVVEPALKVIFVSGYCATDPAAAGLNMRNASFLHKPSSPAALRETIRALFEPEHALT
jgi:two-component system cell cycle sensor histidine kinase/response regulator CckA